ncbi:MAG: hypothetical protein HC883_04290 [Bdellovibrionaceae bacterium]|nr:hypothetical protein [Pseudobdellovibrionaceae bacterium]
MGLVYAVFGGDRYKAVSNEASAFGAEVSILKGSWRFANLVGKIRGLHISGEGEFMDGTTAVTSSFTLFATEPAIGLHWNLMPFYPPGFRVYLSGLGIMSLDHLRFDSATTVTTINKSETAIGFGYEVGAGVEWNIKREKGMWQLFGEIQYRDVKSKLAGQDAFSLTGLQMVGGFGW